TQSFPKQLEVTEQLVKRGQNRFNIYCSPCHGFDGRGNGAIPQRVAASGGAWAARNLVAPPWEAGGHVIKMPNGQLFNTISNGYATMKGYAAQLPHADRWAIVLYIRALQRASNAAFDEVPTEQRENMPAVQAPTPAPAGGATPPAGGAAGSAGSAATTGSGATGVAP
ncbi:MAG: hypothetical protein H6Q90_3556, partial [Deltaproteobacteria bacterium]|nr:hypothetical protein [Deltaproteobacteria bacterium]